MFVNSRTPDIGKARPPPAAARLNDCYCLQCENNVISGFTLWSSGKKYGKLMKDVEKELYLLWQKIERRA